MRYPNPNRLVRPLVRRLAPYTPGEQPKVKGLVKLNTNENPYPPSPRVLRIVRAAVDGRLRLYPNPTADMLRDKLARFYGCSADNIIVGNGSDELLEMAVRCFVEPMPWTESLRAGFCRHTGHVSSVSRHIVQYFTPSYSLYPVLADMHGAVKNPVPLTSDFTLPSVTELLRGKIWDFNAALSFITTPNAPTGRGYPTSVLEALCRVQRGVVVLDEAYAEFANENALSLALRYPHVIVSRTFSKAYSLCFQRVGYFIGHPDLVHALHKIRDSYNVNGLGQLAAEATLDDIAYYRDKFAKIIRTRTALSQQLTALGFQVVPSQTNFVFAKPPQPAQAQHCATRNKRGQLRDAKDWFNRLHEHKILIRWFDQPVVRDYLRITVGTPAQARYLMQVIRQILA